MYLKVFFLHPFSLSATRCRSASDVLLFGKFAIMTLPVPSSSSALGGAPLVTNPFLTWVFHSPAYSSRGLYAELPFSDESFPFRRSEAPIVIVHNHNNPHLFFWSRFSFWRTFRSRFSSYRFPPDVLDLELIQYSAPPFPANRLLSFRLDFFNFLPLCVSFLLGKTLWPKAYASQPVVLLS